MATPTTSLLNNGAAASAAVMDEESNILPGEESLQSHGTGIGLMFASSKLLARASRNRRYDRPSGVVVTRKNYFILVKIFFPVESEWRRNVCKCVS